MKLMINALAIFAFFLLCGYGVLAWQNNQPVAKPNPEKIRNSYEAGVAWLLANRSHVLQDRNPILWWMIKQSAENTHDDRLRLLFAQYEASRSSAELGSVWAVFFEPGKHWGENFSTATYAAYHDYQKYFLFSMTCGKELAESPEIAEQNDPAYCHKKIFMDAACVTHQLMAYRFMQRYGCDRLENIPEKIDVLQRKIHRQLVVDPRVVDVYLQRVLMLVETGAADQVRPVWLERILRAQLLDGGWSDKQPLVSLGQRNSVNFGEKIYRLYAGNVQATFHATAQGVWLMSLLLLPENQAALPLD